MSEAIAVVGVLASILQVIDFTTKLATVSHELLGTADDEQHRFLHKLEELTYDYHNLGSSPAGATADEQEQMIVRLGLHCRIESSNLLDRLADLKIDDKHRGAKRLAICTRNAFRYLKQRPRVEECRRRLEELNGQLATAILQSLHAKSQRYSEPGAQIIAALSAVTGNELDKIRSFIPEHRHLYERTTLLIDSLHFPDIAQRSGCINQAFPRTYRWALTDQKSPVRSWLRNGTGIFWVSGKAGSGKSTFMKFLCEQQETRNLLAEWSSDQACETAIAMFYFWYAGSILQKSTTGLLRTLLHQLLCANPDLAQVTFPKLFAKDISKTSGPVPNREIITWVYNDLINGMKALATHYARSPSRKRHCFFIDGLDEYSGDAMDILNCLDDLVQSGDVKLCVSSRPWNAFQTALGRNYPTIRLEYLTRPDISRYVKTQIMDGMKRCSYEDEVIVTPEAKLLIADIVKKAEGVFLWIVLVVRSIRQGLTERDPIWMLRSRVKDFPADLEDFFRNILDRVDRVYRAHTHQALKLACLYAEDNGPTRKTSTFLDYWLIRQQSSGISCPGFIYDYPDSTITQEKWEKMRSETQATLSASCKDLLCLADSESTVNGSDNSNEGKVEFLHRTVFDFLQTNEMQMAFDTQVPKHFKDGHIFHLLNLAHLKLRRPKTSFYDLHHEILEAVSILDDMPSQYITDAYMESFESNLLHTCEHSGIRFSQRPILFPTFIALRRNEFIVNQIDKLESSAHIDDSIRSALAIAAFGQRPNHKFELEEISISLLQKMQESDGALLAFDGIEQEDDCSSNIWQLFLRKWALSSICQHSVESHEKSSTARRWQMWQLAKWFLSQSQESFPLDQHFCRDNLPANHPKHMHQEMVAADFLGEHVPPEWLQDCEATESLTAKLQGSNSKRLSAESIPSGQGKRRRRYR